MADIISLNQNIDLIKQIYEFLEDNTALNIDKVY